MHLGFFNLDKLGYSKGKNDNTIRKNIKHS